MALEVGWCLCSNPHFGLFVRCLQLLTSHSTALLTLCLLRKGPSTTLSANTSLNNCLLFSLLLPSLPHTALLLLPPPHHHTYTPSTFLHLLPPLSHTPFVLLSAAHLPLPLHHINSHSYTHPSFYCYLLTPITPAHLLLFSTCCHPSLTQPFYSHLSTLSLLSMTHAGPRVWLEQPAVVLDRLASTHPPLISARPEALVPPSLFLHMGQVPESQAGPYLSEERSRFLSQLKHAFVSSHPEEAIHSSVTVAGTQFGSDRHLEEIRFQLDDVGRRARQQAADQQIHSLIIGDDTVPLLVEEREGFLPAGFSLVTVRFLPAEWSTVGAIPAILQAAGYTELEVLAEYGLRDRRPDGTLYDRMLRGDIQLAMVRTPVDDPDLARLPRRFHYAGRRFCKISVKSVRPETRVTSSPSASPTPQQPRAIRQRRRDRDHAQPGVIAQELPPAAPRPPRDPTPPPRRAPPPPPPPPHPRPPPPTHPSAPPPAGSNRFTSRQSVSPPATTAPPAQPASTPTPLASDTHMTYRPSPRTRLPTTPSSLTASASRPPAPYVPPHRKRSASHATGDGQSPDTWGHAGFIPSAMLRQQGWAPGRPLGPVCAAGSATALTAPLDAVADLGGRPPSDRRCLGRSSVGPVQPVRSVQFVGPSTAALPSTPAEAMDEDLVVPDEPLHATCMLWFEDNLVSRQVRRGDQLRVLHRLYMADQQLWREHAGASRVADLPAAVCDALRCGMIELTGDPDCVASDLPDPDDDRPELGTPDPAQPRRSLRASRPPEPYWAGAGRQ